MLTALVILTCRDLFSVRWVAFIGSVIQLALGGMLLVQYNAARAAGNTAKMLLNPEHLGMLHGTLTIMSVLMEFQLQ